MEPIRLFGQLAGMKEWKEESKMAALFLAEVIFFSFLFFFRATPVAYLSSQARG